MQPGAAVKAPQEAMQVEAARARANIMMTDAAAGHVLGYAEREGRPAQIRIGVRTSSCSAYAYTFELDGDLRDDDFVGECGGVRVAVDPKSHSFLDGTTIDFRREGLQEGFQFDNPNVKGTCGCGESFTV